MSFGSMTEVFLVQAKLQIHEGKKQHSMFKNYKIVLWPECWRRSGCKIEEISRGQLRKTALSNAGKFATMSYN